MASNLLTILGLGFRKGLSAVYCLVLLMSSGNVFGQITFDSKEELIEAANSFFEKGEYGKAKPLFSQLLSQDAMNPNYNYRFGVCILFTEDDPVKPMPYIEGGAGSPGVNDEAFYFLGKLYQFNYRFDEAIEAFSKAKGKNVQLSNVNIDSELQACRNGKLLYNPSFEFKPASAKGAIEKEFFRPYDFRKLKGKVIPMPPQFKTKYDEKNLIGSFIFTPLVGQVLFYASYGEDGSNGKDIYRVRKLPNGEWALPMRLPDIINSKLDEDHAFYDAQNDVLYFSSQGHNSMGGLDIFQSAYDAEKDSWSEPVNLQYPYSSPYDDYLYVTDPNLSVAYFTSTRESEEGSVKVFRVQLPSEEGDPVSIITGQYLETADSSQTRMKAQLRANNELVGEYRTNPGTGKYVIVAEPGQGYRLSIAPRDQEAFDFDLNLPKHFKFKPLEQQSLLNTADGQYNLELTNYFNNKGKEDTIVSVQSKTSGELPGLVASVANTEAEKADGAIVDAAEKGREEARQEIAELERQVKEKARQDSIAKTESELAAAEELRKAAEAEELAKQKEQARLDSIAEVERLAKEAELKRQQEEAARLAQEQAEKARQDSIAQAAALAAEEARKAVEAEELAKQKEQARLDSIAEVERLAKEAELNRQQEEATRLAQAQAEKARQDSIAQATALAAEEARKAAEAEELAKQKEQARLDSIAEVERLAKEAELKRQEEEAARLVQEQAEKARQDSIAQAEALAAEEARKAAEAEELAKQKEQARLDSIAEVERLAKEADLKREQEEAARLAQRQAEKARQDSIAQAEMIALEEARLDSINKEVEAMKAAAIREAEMASSSEESEELLQQLAEEQAKEESTANAAELASAKSQVAEESGSTSADELDKALGQMQAENKIVQSSEVAEAEAMAQEIEGTSELDSLNAELANLMIKLSDEGVKRPEKAEEVIALSNEIAELEQIEADKKAERVLAALDERMETAKQMETARQQEKEGLLNAANQSGEEVLSLEEAIADAEKAKEVHVQAEKARQDSIAQAEALSAEEARLAPEAEKLAKEQAEKARQDSIAQGEITAAEQARLEAEAEELAKKQEQARLDSLVEVERLAKEAELKRQEEEADRLAKEQAIQDSIAKAESIAAEELRKAAEAEELAKQKEQSRLDSIAEVEQLAKEAELKRQQEEVEMLAKEQAEKARQDSIAQAALVATEAQSSDVDLSDADAFMKAIEEAEKLKEQAEEPVSAESASKGPELAEATTEESGNTPSGDPFIDEVLGAGPDEVVAQEVSDVIEETEVEKPELDEKAMADSLARELEMEMARAEAEAMEQALKEAEVVQELTAEEIEKVEISTDLDTTEKVEEPVATLEEDVNDEEVLSSVRTELEAQLKEVLPEPIAVEEVATEELAETVESADSISEVVDERAFEMADSASIKPASEAKALEIANSEKARLDSIAKVEAEVAAAEELLKQQEAEEKARKQEELAKIKAEEEERKAEEAAALAIKVAEQAKLDSLAKAEELATMEKEVEMAAEVAVGSTESELIEKEPVEEVEEVQSTAQTNEPVLKEGLSDADAFMKAIEEAEKTKKETALDTRVDEVKAEQGAAEEESTEVAVSEAPADSDLTPDQLLLQKHRELAAQKEKELQEKMNADRAALGLKVEETVQTKEPEIAEVTQVTTKPLETSEPSISKNEEFEPSEETDQQEPVKEELVEVDSVETEEVATTEEVEEPVTEPASTESEIASDTRLETSGTTIEAADDVAMNMEKAIADGASRLFFMTPAMRDYTARRADLSKIEDKTKRRLIQRMLAEDRGRLGVLKNIHNSRIDKASDKQALAKLEANTRNQEVLSGLALANRMVESSSETSKKINWFDRNERMGITYRLMFQFKPSQVSEYVLDAVAASGMPDVEVYGTDLVTGYHTKLAEARAEFLEFRSRGYSNMEIQAFENGSPLKLMEAMNRAVIEK